MIRSPVIPIRWVRDTRSGTQHNRGASRRQEEPSALVLSWRVLRGIVARVPWGRLCLGLAVAVVAGFMPWAIGQGLGMLDQDFTRVRVEGETEKVTGGALQRHLNPFMGTSYFATDLSRIKERAEAMPWVRSAAVGREWPGTLSVSVIEHEPVAQWNGRALVSRKGVVFTPERAAVDGLAALYGPEGKSAEVLAQARAFSEELAAVNLDLEQLRLEARGAWTLLLSNGVRVALGRDRVEERFERFMTAYESRLAPVAAGIKRVDARYGNGVAVRWRDS